MGYMIILFWILISIGCYGLAKEKGRNPLKWFLLGLTMSAVALIILMALPSI